MSGLLRAAANGLWLALSLPEHLRFHRATRDVAGAQRELLFDLVRRNAETEFGRKHAFASIRSIADYRARVPLSNYDDYHEAIGRIGAGENGILTREPVRLLEPTGGSTAGTKLIPYTATLQREFQRGIAAWIADLFLRQPGLLLGQAYWSVTPVARENARSIGGIPIGFADDAEYLGPLQRLLAGAVLAVPAAVKRIADMESFRYVTLLFLLRSRSLSFMSVWNPTYLTLLVARLADWFEALADDIEHGTLNPPSALSADLALVFTALNPADPRRAGEIRSAFAEAVGAAQFHARLWPRLGVISCWTDANAARSATELAALFPQAKIQGKGLLATEGFVSLPLRGHPGAALAIRSGFFEFLPVTADGEKSGREVRLAHEFEVGQRYEVVLTGGGGLYRYQLQDVIEVVGHLRQCPLLRFLGRSGAVSDWFGEKLSELHVSQVLTRAFEAHGIKPVFAMLACETELPVPAYTLLVEAAGAPDETLRLVGQAVETGLAENYHYRYCRELGQLAALQVFRIESGASSAYLAACQAHGQRVGDIKPLALHRRDGWGRVFRGRFVTRVESDAAT